MPQNMLSRRGWLGSLGMLWAQGGRLGLPGAGFAFYDKRLRWTAFPVVMEGEAGWRWVVYEHDGNWLSPYAGAMNTTRQEAAGPKIQLRVEEGWLVAVEKRGEKWRRLRQLMRAEAGEPVVLYPREAHGDLTALWSWGREVYYTNRDYKNVYRVPAGALRARVKGEAVRDQA